MARRRNKGQERDIARERIERLLGLATEALREGRGDRADRYADLAWRIKLRYQLSDSGVERFVCRACHAFLLPGVSSRVRLTRGKRSVTCLGCGETRRRPLRAHLEEEGPPPLERG